MPSVASPLACPFCTSSHRQTKHGKTAFGSQKFRCHACQKNYVPQPKHRGYPKSTRELALKMYVDGLGFRRIGRLLGVSPQTVTNWVNAHHAALPPLPTAAPDEAVEVIEYEAHKDKSETYSVEGNNAELRHHLARLARKNRCFSRCPIALWRAVDLFVRAWNERQIFKRKHPKLPAHVINFIPLLK